MECCYRHESLLFDLGDLHRFPHGRPVRLQDMPT
jgi:hypothetical protein